MDQNDFFSALESGEMMDLLTVEAQFRLGDWISERGFLESAKYFSVVFRHAAGKVKNAVLHCVCAVDMTKDEPKIYVKHALPGDAKPAEAEGLEIYELDILRDIEK